MEFRDWLGRERKKRKRSFFCTLAPGDCEMLLSIMLNAETYIHVQYMMYVRRFPCPSDLYPVMLRSNLKIYSPFPCTLRMHALPDSCLATITETRQADFHNAEI